MDVDRVLLMICVSFCRCPGASSDQQAGQGHGLDGAGLSPEASTYHACPRDSLRSGEATFLSRSLVVCGGLSRHGMCRIDRIDTKMIFEAATFGRNEKVEAIGRR